LDVARKYELKRRAVRQEQTRRRIVEAAVELHGAVGPSRTTISAVAQRAGVQRKTFYRHFPDRDDLLQACSAHFRALNPPPDPSRWLAIVSLEQRVRRGLYEAYRYYRRNEQMMDNVLRDRQFGLPVGDGFLRHRAACKDVLAQGAGGERRRRRRLDAALEVALDFRVWQVLARAGLTDRQAAELAAALVDSALTPPATGRGR
jgi:AcrR family transcriptional regulator